MTHFNDHFSFQYLSSFIWIILAVRREGILDFLKNIWFFGYFYFPDLFLAFLK